MNGYQAIFDLELNRAIQPLQEWFDYFNSCED